MFILSNIFIRNETIAVGFLQINKVKQVNSFNYPSVFHEMLMYD